MKIICPQCNAKYRFPKSRIPDRKAFFPCKRCGKRLSIEPLASAGSDQAQITASENLAPIASRTSKTHNNTIVIEFPQVRAFAPQKYALDQLLLPDRKGRYNTRLNRLKLKLLSAVQETLNQLLDQGEQVVHLAGATAYYPVEIFLGNGWLTMLYNRYVIVSTNKRLVAVNTNYKISKPTHYLFQFPYDEIKKVSRGLFGTSLVLTRKRRKRRVFTGIKRALAAELKAYISAQIDPSHSLDGKPVPHENLCPACFKPLTEKLATCPNCGVLFRSPRKAALRSLLLPGWGDVYLGHRFLGVLEILGSLFVWMVFAGLLLSGDPADLGVGIVLLLFFNGMDSLLTRHMAKKGYSLEKRQPQTAPLGRLSTIRA